MCRIGSRQFERVAINPVEQVKDGREHRLYTLARHRHEMSLAGIQIQRFGQAAGLVVFEQFTDQGQQRHDPAIELEIETQAEPVIARLLDLATNIAGLAESDARWFDHLDLPAGLFQSRLFLLQPGKPGIAQRRVRLPSRLDELIGFAVQTSQTMRLEMVDGPLLGFEVPLDPDQASLDLQIQHRLAPGSTCRPP